MRRWEHKGSTVRQGANVIKGKTIKIKSGTWGKIQHVIFEKQERKYRKSFAYYSFGSKDLNSDKLSSTLTTVHNLRPSPSVALYIMDRRFHSALSSFATVPTELAALISCHYLYLYITL